MSRKASVFQCLCELVELGARETAGHLEAVAGDCEREALERAAAWLPATAGRVFVVIGPAVERVRVIE